MNITSPLKAVFGPQLGEIFFWRFLKWLQLTWLGGSFSETLNQGLLLEASHWHRRLKQQRPFLGIYESQGFTVLLFLACNSPMSICPLPHFILPMYLTGCLLGWLCPNTVHYLRSVLVIFPCYLEKMFSTSQMGRREAAPSISHVVFDDSRFCFSSGTSCLNSTNTWWPSGAEEQRWFHGPALKELPLSLASGGPCLWKQPENNGTGVYKEGWQTPAVRVRSSSYTPC